MSMPQGQCDEMHRELMSVLRRNGLADVVICWAGISSATNEAVGSGCSEARNITSAMLLKANVIRYASNALRDMSLQACDGDQLAASGLTQKMIELASGPRPGANPPR